MTASLDLNFDEEQRAVYQAVQRFCQRADVEQLSRDSATPVPRAHWQQLAQLGVFAPALASGVGSADGGDNTRTLCAVAEALGEHAFPGPIGATCLAAQLLPPELAQQVVEGRLLATLQPSGSQLIPYGRSADIFLIHTDDGIARAQPDGPVETVDTLGHIPWGKAALTAVEVYPAAAPSLALMHIINAAYLAALAMHLLQLTAKHATTRKQFGRALGDFQAVSQPLATCAVNLTAAQSLARNAAFRLDSLPAGAEDSEPLAWACAALHAAASASQQCAFDCHQVFGALGVTLEGPVFHRTRRIRQLLSECVDHGSLLPPLLADIGLEDCEHD